MIDPLMIAICHEFAEDSIVDRALANQELKLNNDEKIDLALDIFSSDPNTELANTELEDMPNERDEVTPSNIEDIHDTAEEIEDIPDYAEVPDDVTDFEIDYVINNDDNDIEDESSYDSNDDFSLFDPSVKPSVTESDPEDDIPEWAKKLEASLIDHDLLLPKDNKYISNNDYFRDNKLGNDSPKYVEIEDDFNATRN